MKCNNNVPNHIEELQSTAFLSVVQICEPFYGDYYHKIYATCIYYFIPTLVFMYCYGSIFHASKFKSNSAPPRDNGEIISDKERCVSSQGMHFVAYPVSIQNLRLNFLVNDVLFILMYQILVRIRAVDILVDLTVYKLITHKYH